MASPRCTWIRFALVASLLICSAGAWHEDGQGASQEVEPAAEVAIGVVDTAGTFMMLFRPLVQYQWLVPALPGGLPQVERVRSARVVVEEEVTAELYAFHWEDLRSLTRVESPEGIARTLVVLADGQNYRCMLGYTHAGDVPALLGRAPMRNPDQVTMVLKATRRRAKQQVSVDTPWSSVASIDVFSLAGKSAVDVDRIERLLQERTALHKREGAIESELDHYFAGPQNP